MSIEETFSATVETITPDLAAEWLVHNTHNRNKKPTVIAKYASDISADRWEFNGEPIKFSDTGLLLDGQNRLYAIIEAQRPIESLVVRGLRAETQDTMDLVAPRSLKDILRLRGEVNCSTLGAGINRYWGYLRAPTNTSWSAYPSIRAALALLEDHPGLRDSARFSQRVSHAVGLTGSVAVALHYITENLDSDDSLDFWDKLISRGDLPDDDPVFHLRRVLLAERNAAGLKRAKMSPVRTWIICVKAWNSYRRGEKVKILRWSPGGARPEGVPVPE